MAAHKGRILTIAGSDSGGGAGIQADLKTVTALGGYGASAITAVTAQNTLEVRAIHPIPPDIIAAQITCVLEDIGADCIKTGMLLNAQIIEVVAERLVSLASSIPLVIDPVMVATSGARLVDEDAVAALKSLIIPGAALLTPNIPEAGALCSLSIESEGSMLRAGRALLEMGAEAVLLKGGHMPGGEVEISDLLLDRHGHEFLRHPRIPTRHTHGTGCTLASAVATGLAQGMPLTLAVRRARRYVQEAIRSAPGFGAGHGPLNHGHTAGLSDGL